MDKVWERIRAKVNYAINLSNVTNILVYIPAVAGVVEAGLLAFGNCACLQPCEGEVAWTRCALFVCKTSLHNLHFLCVPCTEFTLRDPERYCNCLTWLGFIISMMLQPDFFYTFFGHTWDIYSNQYFIKNVSAPHQLTSDTTQIDTVSAFYLVEPLILGDDLIC